MSCGGVVLSASRSSQNASRSTSVEQSGSSAKSTWSSMSALSKPLTVSTWSPPVRVVVGVLAGVGVDVLGLAGSLVLAVGRLAVQVGRVAAVGGGGVLGDGPGPVGLVACGGGAGVHIGALVSVGDVLGWVGGAQVEPGGAGHQPVLGVVAGDHPASGAMPGDKLAALRVPAAVAELCGVRDELPGVAVLVGGVGVALAGQRPPAAGPVEDQPVIAAITEQVAGAVTVPVEHHIAGLVQHRGPRRRVGALPMSAQRQRPQLRRVDGGRMVLVVGHGGQIPSVSSRRAS